MLPVILPQILPVLTPSNVISDSVTVGAGGYGCHQATGELEIHNSSSALLYVTTQRPHFFPIRNIFLYVGGFV